MEYDGLIEGFNQGEGFANITVTLEDKSTINIKVTNEQLEGLLMGRAYHFTTILKTYHDKEQIVLVDYKDLLAQYNEEELLSVLPKYYISAPTDLEEDKRIVEKCIDEISNEAIKSVVSNIYQRKKLLFSIYPAATRFHHAYIGGLLYHTVRMLEASKPLMEVYPFFNQDLVVAGIILHDMAKVYEFSGPFNPYYTLEGQLLGHIVMGAMEIEKEAVKLGIEGEEGLLLKHIVLSHHGHQEYGSPKRPMIPEALLISLLDNMDSKLTVLEDNIKATSEGEFTQPLAVLEKMRFYHHKL